MMALRLLAANRSVIPHGVRLADGRRSSVVVTDRGRSMWLLDAIDLSVLRCWRLPDDANGSHAVRTTDHMALVCRRGAVSLLDADGRAVWSLRHHPWEDRFSRGAAWFDSEGRPFALVPRPDGGCQVVHLDARIGTPRHLAPLATEPAGVDVLHQDDGWTGLSVGEGQDGVYACWVRLSDEALELLHAPWADEILFDVDARGDRVLTTPHEIGPIRIRSFPELSLLREIPPPPGVWWDFSACFVGDRVVARAHGRDGGDEEVLLAVDEAGAVTQLAESAHSIMPGPHGSWLASTAEGVERWGLQGDAAGGGVAQDG